MAQGPPRVWWPLRDVCVRRRPTLPQPLDCSTIGAERLNFRVRYGTGCFPFAMAAVTLSTLANPIGFVGWELLSGRETSTQVCVCVWCFVRGWDKPSAY